jgi:hypothetical protein
MVESHAPQVTLSSRLEDFAREQVFRRAERSAELMISLLRREGGLTHADGVVRVGGRPITAVQEVFDDVAAATGLSMALFIEERLVVSSTTWLRDGGSTSLPRDLQAPLGRGEPFSGVVDLGDRQAFVVARLLAMRTSHHGVLVCGTTAQEARHTVEGLATIEAELAGLADQVQSERQRAVADFLKIIRSIAKRIHLLALNASILSAQAGDQGRGFAVVAREIGELAERTRQSTQELENEFSGRVGTEADRRSGGRAA